MPPQLLKGLAAGDRNGGPIRMALLLFDSLKQHPSFDPQAVLEAYFQWFEQGAYDTGATLYHTFSLIKRGFSHSKAVELSYTQSPSDGIAPAHRSTPLALFLEGSDLDDALYQESKLTHHSEISAQIAIATGRICAHLLKDVPLSEAISLSLTDLDPHLFPPFHDLHMCRPTGYAPHVLQAALHFLNHYPSFTDALLASLTFAGPANYCPVLVGSIGGCLYPHSHIDPTLLNHPQTPQRFLS